MSFRNSPGPRCSVLELAFSKAEIRSFSKANGRLSATWNTSLLDLLLVYKAASHSSNCKTIIIIPLFTFTIYNNNNYYYYLYYNYSLDIIPYSTVRYNT